MCTVRHGLDSGIEMMERNNCEIGNISLSSEQWEKLKKDMENICVFPIEEKDKLPDLKKGQVGTYRGYPVFVVKNSLLGGGYISSKEE